MSVGSSGFVVASLLGHVGIPGLAPFVAILLFMAGAAAAFGVYLMGGDPRTSARRAGRIAVGALAIGCFVTATVMPFIIHATPLLTRPKTSAILEIVSPRPGELIRGDPATIPVEVRLTGGRIVPNTSLHLVANEGHIHLYLDGSILGMTGLTTDIIVLPGVHTLRAEFVAVDHGPFRPPVIASVTFRVRA
ncbi:MAG: hypothetical protein ACRDH7_00045 [Actinomycetota bacterium]